MLSCGLPPQYLFCHFSDRSRALDHMYPGLSHRLHLFGGGPLASCNDRPGMAHAPSGRRRAPRNKSDYWFLELPLYIRRGFFFRGAADFSDENDRVGSVIILEKHEGVEEPSANYRISPDS